MITDSMLSNSNSFIERPQSSEISNKSSEIDESPLNIAKKKYSDKCLQFTKTVAKGVVASAAVIGAAIGLTALIYAHPVILAAGAIIGGTVLIIRALQNGTDWDKYKHDMIDIKAFLVGGNNSEQKEGYNLKSKISSKLRSYAKDVQTDFNELKSAYQKKNEELKIEKDNSLLENNKLLSEKNKQLEEKINSLQEQLLKKQRVNINKFFSK